MPRKTAPAQEVVFFLDRSLGGKVVAEALRAKGATVIVHDEVFGQDTPDVVWLGKAGCQGWVVLTKDSTIRRNPYEKTMFREARVRVFVLTRKDLSGREMADLLVLALRDMLRKANAVPPPFVFSIDRNGKLTRLE